MTQIEVNELEDAEIAAWKKYKASVDESQKLLAVWLAADGEWKNARKVLQDEQLKQP